MTWTAKLISVDKVEGRVRTVIAFSDGTNSFQKECYLGSGQTLPQLARAEIKVAEELYGKAKDFELGEIDLSQD